MCEGLGKPLDSKATKVHDIYAIGSQVLYCIVGLGYLMWLVVYRSVVR